MPLDLFKSVDLAVLLLDVSGETGRRRQVERCFLSHFLFCRKLKVWRQTDLFFVSLSPALPLI